MGLFISLFFKHWLQLIDTMLTDDDKNQERREDIVCVLWLILIEKAQRPARIETDSAKKDEGQPRIQTQPARTEACYSTACATTAAPVKLILDLITVFFFPMPRTYFYVHPQIAREAMV